ncbi:MAG: DUF2267 domain-containing protein [Chloroflexota bacterium]
MTQSSTKLDNYFSAIQTKGNIISEKLAKRWSESTLKMMGLYMAKDGKKALSGQLPQELSDQLNRVFRLLHFPNTNMPMQEFQSAVARRGGHSDPQFAKLAIIGVFHGLKTLIDKDTTDKVSESLSPEIREVWDNA